MNTRLQVEHPVSEEVFGLDFVEWQLKVASGGVLPPAFADLKPRGHSVEVRVYAEDVHKAFFPAPGPIAAFKPALGPGIRWEIGLDELDQVTGRFDPMIAKLVVTADSRPAALARLADAIDRTFFAGPPSNLELVRDLVTTAPFVLGPVTTHDMLRDLDAILARCAARRAPLLPLAARLLGLIERGEISAATSLADQSDADGLTVAAFAAKAPQLLGSKESPADLGAEGAPDVLLSFAAKGGRDFKAESRSGIGALTTAAPGSKNGDGSFPSYFWYASLRTPSLSQYWVALNGLNFTKIAVAASATERKGPAQTSTEILAPVPGKVIAIHVAAAADVAEGHAVFVLESMKMEFEVKAARGGVIDSVHVKIGDQVTAGLKLASWKP